MFFPRCAQRKLKCDLPVSGRSDSTGRATQRQSVPKSVVIGRVKTPYKNRSGTVRPARLRHIAGTQWSARKYMKMAPLHEALNNYHGAAVA